MNEFAHDHPSHETSPFESAAIPGEASVTSELTDDDCAFQRQLVEQLAVHVGVKRRSIFQQVLRSGFHRDAFRGARHRQSNV